ncbi:hypothetical protein BJX70DRAFT_402880 [Aspergillus crustosus]
MSVDIMDPFAAIGLAGNIVTRIDFGFKIVGKAREIQITISGATADSESLASMEARFYSVVDSV